MLMLLVDLVAERVKQDPIPVGLLSVLTMVFDSLMQSLIFGYLAFRIYAANAFLTVYVVAYCLTSCRFLTSGMQFIKQLVLFKTLGN